jgi:hypothetical protein
MKDIDKKDAPETSGGFRPADDGCILPTGPIVDYPKLPIGPVPEPWPQPECDSPYLESK